MKTFIAAAILLIANTLTAQEAIKNTSVFSDRAVEAYEIKAESKVNEFFSYLTLLSDPEGNAEMKAQAAAEAAKLFRNGDVMVQNFFDSKQSVTNVNKLLEAAAAQKKKVNFSATSFAIIPKGKTDTRHDWVMTYEVIINNRVVKVSQGFSIILEEKKFGGSTKKVWNSYLGELR